MILSRSSYVVILVLLVWKHGFVVLQLRSAWGKVK